MQKVGGVWSPIIFRRILFVGADGESWWDLEPQKFLPDSFGGSWLIRKVGGIWSPIIFRRILFEGADAESWRDLKIYNFWLDSF